MTRPSPSFSRRSAILSGLCASAAPAFLPRAAMAVDADPAPTHGPDMSDAAVAARRDALAAKRKINLAGRQRMLTQRIAKAAAFVNLGIEPLRHMTMMDDAHALFERTLIGLRHGDEAFGLTPESDPKVLRSLSHVERLWGPYGATVQRTVKDGGVDADAMAAIADLNMPALEAMQASVTAFEGAYGDWHIPLGLAIAINVSGRQRMLSQKMTKEAALCALGHEVDANSAALADTANLFDLSLTALTVGLPTVSIIAPPTPEIEAKLNEVAGIWAEFKPMMALIARRDMPDRAELETVAAYSDKLLVTMNQAVWLYERA